MILSTDWNGMQCILVDKHGDPVRKGDTLLSFRDEKNTITGGSAPHKPSSSGFVYTGDGMRYYPGVFECRWADAVEVVG